MPLVIKLKVLKKDTYHVLVLLGVTHQKFISNRLFRSTELKSSVFKLRRLSVDLARTPLLRRVIWSKSNY